jgi:hypothetical protein
MHGFQTSLNRKKNSMKIVKKATRSNQVRCLFFKKTDVKAEREEKLTHKVTQQKRHRGKNPEKAILEGFWPKGAGALLPKARSVIALCVRLWGSVGALLTLGQGRQGLKVPKMSKNSKNCNSNSTIMLSVMG